MPRIKALGLSDNDIEKIKTANQSKAKPQKDIKFSGKNEEDVLKAALNKILKASPESTVLTEALDHEIEKLDQVAEILFSSSWLAINSNTGATAYLTELPHPPGNWGWAG